MLNHVRKKKFFAKKIKSISFALSKELKGSKSICEVTLETFLCNFFNNEKKIYSCYTEIGNAVDYIKCRWKPNAATLLQFHFSNYNEKLDAHFTLVHG